MLKNFNIDTVTIFKPDSGFFVAETVDGEKVVGFCIIPPFGLITVDAKEERDTYSRSGGTQWKCGNVSYDDLDAVTHSLLASGMLSGIKESKAEHVFNSFGSQIWTILTAAAD